MTKEDFYIIRNSITMRQVAEYYGFRINNKGFMKCPFHANGTERTASLKIFPDYGGFQCKGCGQAGDVTKFVQIYENLTPKEAGIVLAERFGVEISENGNVPPETVLKAKQAQFDREQANIRQSLIQAEFRQLGALIRGYERVVLTAEPFSEVYCYAADELPKMIGKWEELLSELRK